MTPDAVGFSSKGWNCESQSEAEGVLKIGRPPVIIHMFIRHFPVPSGKHTKNYGKSPFSMGKSTISMAIFNSYVKSPEGNHPVIIHKSGPLRKPPHYLVILSRLKHPHLSPRLPTSSSVTEKESKLMLNISSPMACSTATCAWKTGETVLNHGLCAWLCLYIQNVHDTYLHSYTNIAWIFCHGTYIILYTVYTCLHQKIMLIRLTSCWKYFLPTPFLSGRLKEQHARQKGKGPGIYRTDFTNMWKKFDLQCLKRAGKLHFKVIDEPKFGNNNKKTPGAQSTYVFLATVLRALH